MAKTIFALLGVGTFGTFVAYWFLMVIRLMVDDFVTKKKYRNTGSWFGLLLALLPVVTYELGYLYGMKELLLELFGK
ncbi:hypothetical protein [Gemmiger sp.]|jgi:hypothetical protein|uniref:hypothetical protein n=1 Tax=Gemmiger sp. TaxID=2049027 RepID=UPI002053DF8D|nr:MAG TPA: hypothetical protein [Caudoviricetes sp.]